MVTTKTKSQKETKSKSKSTETSEAMEQLVDASAEQDTVDNKQEYKVKKNLDLNMYVTVKNGYNGTLVYKSKKTGETFIWEEFGSEQEMELSELKSAKNTSKAFFINNWFLFDDPEIIDWLGMTQYYKNALNSDSFDKLFEKKPEEIKATIANLSAGQKKTVIFRAKQLIEEGKIDSIKVITALENSLSVELIER
jgi:hypothetical protein